MPLFAPDNRDRTDRHAEIYAAHELAYTTVDFLAAAAFVAGSVLFFFDSTQIAATWLFLVGSIFFALKPTIRLARELRLAALDRKQALARRVEG